MPERGETHHNNALAQMVDRGSAQDLPPGLDAPIVVICGDSLEDEVIGAEGPQDAREARHRRRRRLVTVDDSALVGGDGEGRVFETGRRSRALLFAGECGSGAAPDIEARSWLLDPFLLLWTHSPNFDRTMKISRVLSLSG